MTFNKRGHPLLASIKSCQKKKVANPSANHGRSLFTRRSVARYFEILPDVFVQTKFANSSDIAAKNSCQKIKKVRKLIAYCCNHQKAFLGNLPSVKTKVTYIYIFLSFIESCQGKRIDEFIPVGWFGLRTACFSVWFNRKVRWHQGSITVGLLRNDVKCPFSFWNPLFRALRAG